MFLVDNLWKVLHLKHFISKEDIIYQSLESKPRFSCLIFSKGASFIAFALWYMMNKSCKIEEKYLFKQILVGILIFAQRVINWKGSQLS